MFKTILYMAYRNALLRLSRTILLILMISMSMGTMVALEGLYDGMSQHMINKAKRSDSGEISLYARSYRLEDDIKYHIDNVTQKSEILRQIPGVTQLLWRIQANGLAQTARKSDPARVVGIDPLSEETFGRFSDFLQEGTLDFGKNGVFVGSEIAKKLKLHIGSKLIFTTQDSKLEIQSIALHVKAIIHTSNIKLDEHALFVQREKLVSLLSLPKDSATQIALRSDSRESSRLKSRIQKIFPDLDVETFTELYPQLKQMQSLMDIFNEITFAIVMVVVFIGILGVMYVSILERIREFGILLSIGYAYRYIRWQIMAEALFLGLTGYIFGLLFGLLILVYLKYYGLDLSIFSEGMSMFGLESTIYATIRSSYFVSTFFAILAASLLSVLLPLQKIKKLNPIEVIRDAT